MTKAELVAAIAAAPDDALVYIDTGVGILHSQVAVDADGSEIILSFTKLSAADDGDEQ